MCVNYFFNEAPTRAGTPAKDQSLGGDPSPLGSRDLPVGRPRVWRRPMVPLITCLLHVLHACFAACLPVAFSETR